MCLQDPCRFVRAAAARHRLLTAKAIATALPHMQTTTAARILDRPDLSKSIFDTFFQKFATEAFQWDIHWGLAWHSHCDEPQYTQLLERFGNRIKIDPRIESEK